MTRNTSEDSPKSCIFPASVTPQQQNDRKAVRQYISLILLCRTNYAINQSCQCSIQQPIHHWGQCSRDFQSYSVDHRETREAKETTCSLSIWKVIPSWLFPIKRFSSESHSWLCRVTVCKNKHDKLFFKNSKKCWLLDCNHKEILRYW